MNKKIIIVSIAAVFTLVAISFASAVSIQTAKPALKKGESPLFRIRTGRAIKEKIEELKEAIKAWFVRDRIFFLPFRFQLLRLNNHQQEEAMGTCDFDGTECIICWRSAWKAACCCTVSPSWDSPVCLN